MNDNKYYTPAIEEFYVGFEYEFNGLTMGGLTMINFKKGTSEVIKEPHQKVWSPEKIAISSLEGRNLKDIPELLKSNQIRVKYLNRKDIEDEDWKFDEKYSAITENHHSMVFSKKATHRGEEKIFMMIYNPISNWLLLSATGKDGVSYMLNKSFKEPSIPIIDITTNGTIFAGIIKNKSQLKQILQWTRILKD